MRNLFDSPFFECVRDGIRTTEIPTPEIIMGHYRDFTVALASAVKKEESVLSLFRYLRLLYIELCSYCKHMENCVAKNKSVIVNLLRKALGLVEVELDVVQLKIKHYGLSAGKSADARDEVPVFWSKEYTATDLMELIVALYESGALVYRDGSKIGLVAMVRLFEHAFHITIKDPRGLRFNVINRKIKATKFLDVLSANFIELCER